jgi:DNA-binding MarR family transcriptional regulator
MPAVQDFDANEKALFDSVALHWSLGRPLTVRAAIEQELLGSPAALHKRLQRLIAKEWVVAQIQVADRRAKFLVPSEKGLFYIEWLSAQMTSMQAD